jgi:hypothetical protein
MSIELAETRRNTAAELLEMKPLMIDYRTTRDQQKGASKFARRIYAFLTLLVAAGAAFAGYKVHG